MGATCVKTAETTSNSADLGQKTRPADRVRQMTSSIYSARISAKGKLIRNRRKTGRPTTEWLQHL